MKLKDAKVGMRVRVKIDPSLTHPDDREYRYDKRILTVRSTSSVDIYCNSDDGTDDLVFYPNELIPMLVDNEMLKMKKEMLK